jgi:hypothetical protein
MYLDIEKGYRFGYIWKRERRGKDSRLICTTTASWLDAVATALKIQAVIAPSALG